MKSGSDRLFLWTFTNNKVMCFISDLIFEIQTVNSQEYMLLEDKHQ